jgi:hypothetical protein
MAKTPARTPALWVVEIDGQAGGAFDGFTPPAHEFQETADRLGERAFGNPKIGPAVATLSMAASGPLSDWVDASMNGEVRPAQLDISLVDSRFTPKIRLEMSDCLITGINFPQLDGTAAKEMVFLTVTLQAGALQYKRSIGRVTAPPASKRKAWLASSFALTASGFDGTRVSRIDLPSLTMKLPPGTGGTRGAPGQSPSLEIGSLTTEHAPGEYGALMSFGNTVEDGTISGAEHMDLTVDMLDASHGAVLGTFSFKGCAPRKISWADGSDDAAAPAVRLEFVPASLTFERKEPAPAIARRAASRRPKPAGRRRR